MHLIIKTNQLDIFITSKNRFFFSCTDHIEVELETIRIKKQTETQKLKFRKHPRKQRTNGAHEQETNSHYLHNL
jgi:hypothetical protein